MIGRLPLGQASEVPRVNAEALAQVQSPLAARRDTPPIQGSSSMADTSWISGSLPTRLEL